MAIDDLLIYKVAHTLLREATMEVVHYDIDGMEIARQKKYGQLYNILADDFGLSDEDIGEMFDRLYEMVINYGKV